MVKQTFAQLVSRNLAEHLGKRPIESTQAERERNPRARSAKMRIIRVCGQMDERPPVV